jgi:hypothetical protein
MAKDDIEDKLNALVAGQEVSTDVVRKPRVAVKKEVVQDEDAGIDLTEEEKAEIRADAKKEVARELKAEKIKAFKADEKQRLKKQVLFQHGKDETGENPELVFVQLAPHMPYIRLDNNVYYPNRAYRLSPAKAAVVKEQMYRGDLHDNEISGKNMKAFYGHRPQNLVLNPNTPIPGGVN